MKKLLTMTVAALAAAELFAVQGTLMTESETLKGDIRWQGGKKIYTVSIVKNKRTIDMERKLSEVTGLDIPVPQGYEKAVKAVEEGQGAAAVPVLQKIVADYRMLQWDKPAARYLVQALVDAGKAKDALRVSEGIIAEDKEAAYRGELASSYWRALLKTGDYDKLEACLKKAAACQDRRASAAALVMRGDIIVAGSNDVHERLKDALRDGYLRVYLMYTDPACAGERREAMLKAAECFAKIGQMSRAENLRTQARSL